MEPRKTEVILQALRVRLADAGMFKAEEQKQGAKHKEKKKGHRFHLRHKHKAKDASRGSQSQGNEEADGSESFNSTHTSKADSTSEVSMPAHSVISISCPLRGTKLRLT